MSGTPPDGTTVNGLEANLLLFLLDDYIGGLARPDGRRILGYTDPADLKGLRERLFAAHRHPPEADDGA